MAKKKKKAQEYTGSLFPELAEVPAQPASKKTSKQIEEELERLRQENAGLQAEKARLVAENGKLQQDVANFREKAEMYDCLMQSTSSFTTTVVAKALGMSSAEKLNAYLQGKGVQYYSKSDGCWLLCSRYSKKGYTTYRWHEYGTKSSYATPMSRPHMYWTLKGVEFIRSLLRKDGLL